MDYTKLTKQELIEKLEEQVHLASAIEAKDEEVIRVQERFRKIEESLRTELNDAKKKLSSYKDALTKEQVDSAIKETQTQAAKAFEMRNEAMIAYTNYLKQQKVNLDIQIQINELLEKLAK